MRTGSGLAPERANTSKHASVLKRLAAVAGVGAMLATASSATAATQVFLQSASMATSGTAKINGALVNQNARSAPITFSANPGSAFDSATTYSFLGWCIDIYHSITLGTLNLQYAEGAFTDDQNGVPLSKLQRNKISSLVNYGTWLYGNGGTSNQMAALQGAIWRIENPAYTITGGNTGIQTLMAQYAADAAVVYRVGRMHTIFNVARKTQGFAVGDGVPEPATWLTLLVGFGGLGAMARRARQRTVLALAN